jgi:cell division control protein 45
MVRHDVNQETGNPRALTEAIRLIRERSAYNSAIEEDSVLILAAAEADGVCSAHILTSILKLEGIKYTLQSVNTYSELDESLRSSTADSRTIVLLNCGAVIDLTKHMDFATDIVLIVIDSHRPIHLKNVRESSRILVLDDDLGRGGYFPTELLEEDVDDQEFIDDVLGDDEEEIIHQAEKRQRTSNDDIETRRKERQKLISEYYEGYYYGSPTSLVLYTMATDMGYQTQQLLWLACVGLASYMEMGYFSPDTFRGIAQEIDNHYMVGESENQAPGGLRFSEDLRLVMYRHWPLFQSMWHTPYVYSKLELHRDHGHGTIQKLLVFAGISPENYNQNFSSMSHSAKKLLVSDKFKKKCIAFGIDDIKHYQFIRSVRMKDEDKPSLMLNELAASDLYFMLTLAIQMRGFNFAMDVAVNTAPLAAMHECISRALDTHRDICVQAKMILDKRSWRLVDGFRFSVIEKPTSGIFQQSPHAVRWLAMFLMTVFSHRKQSAPLMPLLICVRHESNYICVGVDPQDTKSEFVFRFRSACAITAVQIQLNSFDFALAQVPAASFETWSTALLGGDNADGVDDYESDPSVVDEDIEDNLPDDDRVEDAQDDDEVDEGDLISSEA